MRAGGAAGVLLYEEIPAGSTLSVSVLLDEWARCECLPFHSG